MKNQAMTEVEPIHSRMLFSIMIPSRLHVSIYKQPTQIPTYLSSPPSPTQKQGRTDNKTMCFHRPRGGCCSPPTRRLAIDSKKR